MTHFSPMPYGKHAGKLMCETPAYYLLNLWYSEGVTSDVADYIRSNQVAIKQAAKVERLARKFFKGDVK